MGLKAPRHTPPHTPPHATRPPAPSGPVGPQRWPAASRTGRGLRTGTGWASKHLQPRLPGSLPMNTTDQLSLSKPRCIWISVITPRSAHGGPPSGAPLGPQSDRGTYGCSSISCAFVRRRGASAVVVVRLLPTEAPLCCLWGCAGSVRLLCLTSERG